MRHVRRFLDASLEASREQRLLAAEQTTGAKPVFMIMEVSVKEKVAVKKAEIVLDFAVVFFMIKKT